MQMVVLNCYILHCGFEHYLSWEGNCLTKQHTLSQLKNEALFFLQYCFIKQNRVGSNKLSQRGKRENNHFCTASKHLWLLNVHLIQGNMFLSATRHRRNQTEILALSRWLFGEEQKAFSVPLFFSGIAGFALCSKIVWDPPFVFNCFVLRWSRRGNRGAKVTRWMWRHQYFIC